MRCRHCLLLLLLSSNSLAQTLQVDKGLVTGDDSLKRTLLLSSPLSGQGQLTLNWSDSYGRTVTVQSRQVLSVSLRLEDLVTWRAELREAAPVSSTPGLSARPSKASIAVGYQE